MRVDKGSCCACLAAPALCRAAAHSCSMFLRKCGLVGGIARVSRASVASAWRPTKAVAPRSCVASVIPYSSMKTEVLESIKLKRSMISALRIRMHP